MWISEIGWQAGAVGPQGVATNLQNSLQAISNNNNVTNVQWFTLQDWPGVDWGLLDQNGNPRPAFSAFQQAADKFN